MNLEQFFFISFYFDSKVFQHFFDAKKRWQRNIAATSRPTFSYALIWLPIKGWSFVKLFRMRHIRFVAAEVCKIFLIPYSQEFSSKATSTASKIASEFFIFAITSSEIGLSTVSTIKFVPPMSVLPTCMPEIFIL